MSGVSVHGAMHPVMTGKSAGNVAGEIDSRERPATWRETWTYQVQLAWKLEVRLLCLPEQNNAIQFCDSRARLEVNLEDCCPVRNRPTTCGKEEISGATPVGRTSGRSSVW